MSVFKGLEPKIVWDYFEEILQVPRPSKKEEKIIEYLKDFGKKQNLETKVDEIGNVLISKPATKGMENRKSVLLQSHIDMVCEKNADTVFDFDNDAIQARIDGEWVKATGTTLGADDGIGIAAQLAILASDDIQHGPIECLFTVDEETGLTGAFALKEGFFKSDILLNLDSEDEGELFIGCAGGIDTLAEMEYEKTDYPKSFSALRFDVKGLNGGHSGDEIDKGLGNANKILNRFLWKYHKEYDIRISEFNGGNLRNAIAREAFAITVLPDKNVEKIKTLYDSFAKDVKFEYSVSEKNLDLLVSDAEKPEFVIDSETQFRLLNAIYACPHGVIAMSQQIKAMVETSTNLASVKTGDKKIDITTSQRSSINSSKEDIASMVESVFLLAGANVIHSDGYPGWAPNTDSEIMKITESSYEKLFSEKPVVRAIHAGLECGLFLEKYPDLDMISFGPTIKGAHSPDERLDIKTTQKFWDLLLDVLKEIPGV